LIDKFNLIGLESISYEINKRKVEATKKE
jgi:hypothetical protein